MEGRLSMEKAKKVREKRELQKELGEWIFFSEFLILRLFGLCSTRLPHCGETRKRDDIDTDEQPIQRTYKHSKKPSYTAPPHAPKSPRTTKERRRQVGMRVMWKMRTKILVGR